MHCLVHLKVLKSDQKIFRIQRQISSQMIYLQKVRQKNKINLI